MRFGINGSGMMMSGSLDAVANHAKQADADGFASYWVNQSTGGGGTDALMTIMVAAREAKNVEFGTAIIPTFPIHPAVLGKQAFTAQTAIGERLCLGIGLSHATSVEGGLGMSYDRPIGRMKEYLTVLDGTVNHRMVDFDGEFYTCHGDFTIQSGKACSVVVAALGPQMLRLTGRLADGTILWLGGPKAIAEHIKPNLDAGAEKAGRPEPRIIASCPVSVTDNPDEVRGAINGMLANYGTMPNYRKLLDREGVEGPGDVSVIGNEDSVREQLSAYAEAGATDFAAVEWPAGPEEMARTRALLKELAAASN